MMDVCTVSYAKVEHVLHLTTGVDPGQGAAIAALYAAGAAIIWAVSAPAVYSALLWVGGCVEYHRKVYICLFYVPFSVPAAT